MHSTLSLAMMSVILGAMTEQTEQSAKPAATSPVLVEPDAKLVDIQLSVFDSTGNKPLPAFRVIAGVRSGVSREFEKEAGRPVVNWQPHTLRIGKDGDLLWPLAKAYEEMALRV